MVGSKHHYFTHLGLILILMVVLFPLFWVFTTSIRRDNAAFSTELVSTRFTFQHYKELIFKPKNIPTLIADMKKAVNISEEYKGKSEAQIQGSLTDLIAKFEKILASTDEYLNNTDQDIQKMNSFYDVQQKLVLDQFMRNYPAFLSQLQKFTQDTIDSMAEEVKILLDSSILEKIAETGILPDNQTLVELRFPELYSAFVDVTQKTQTLLNATQEELKILLAENSVTPAVRDQLNNSFFTLKGLIATGGFTYTKWLREISIKVYNPLNGVIQAIADEHLTTLWELYKENQKNSAREIEQFLKDFNTKVLQLSTIIKALKAEKIDNPLQNLNALNQAQEARTVLLNQNAAQKLKNSVEINTIENRISFFQQQIDVQIAFQVQAEGIIRTFFEKPSFISTDAIVLEKWNSILVQTNALLATLQTLENSPNFPDNLNLNSLNKSLRFIVDNKEKIVSYLGYVALSDSISVYANTYLQLVPLFGDVEGSLSERTKKLAQLDSLNAEYEKIEKERITENERLSVISIEAVKLQNNIVEAKRNYDLLLLKNQLSTVTNWELVSAFVTSYTAYQDAYPAEKANFPSFIAIFEPVSYLNRLKELTEDFANQKNVINLLTKTLREKEQEFEQRSSLYISLRMKGSQIKVQELTEIEDGYLKAYENFSFSLNRAGRRATDLAKIPFFVTVKNDLKNIDKQIYDLVQLWNKKPDQFFMQWLLNSVIVAVLTAFFTVVVCALGAYPFSRMRFPGRKYGLLFLVLLQMFPSIMAMVALYSLLRFTGKIFPMIGLDTIGGVIFIYLGGLPFNMWLLKGYFDTIPDSMEESAMIDGATRFQTFIKIVLPLAVPILAVVFILCFMGTFNEFVLARIMLQNPKNYTFAVGLQSFANGPFQMEWGLFTAAALIGAIPMVIVFLFMQKYLVSGLTSGAVKG